MNEVSNPSYRLRHNRHDRQILRVVFTSGLIILVMAIVSGLCWRFAEGTSPTVPLIEAEVLPIKVRPDNPGGLHVSNQDVAIFAGMRGAQNTVPIGLGPEVENPRLDQLRAAVSR
jgi:hypothetical protein